MLINLTQNISVDSDLYLYVNREKKPERVHQYSMALQLLESEFQRR